VKNITVEGKEIIIKGHGPVEIEGPDEDILEQYPISHLKYENGRIAKKEDLQIEAIETEARRLKDLEGTEPGYVRVLEDLLDLLEAKGIINVTDLPQEAQDRHNYRKSLRE
jgi:hypothetical protein